MSLARAHPPENSRTESRRTAVQARVRWGSDAVLREHHLDHGAPYRVRVDAESAALDPTQDASAVSVASPEGDRLRIIVPSGVTVTVVHENERRDLRALAAAGRIEERGPAGEPSFLLEEGETAELAFGDLVHELSLVELLEPTRPRIRAPKLLAGSMLVSALLISIVSARGHRPTSRAGGSELPDLQNRAVAALIRERSQQPIPPAIRHRAVVTMPSPSPTSASALTPATTSASPALPAPSTLANAASASRASRAVESTSGTASPPPEPEVEDSPSPTAEELAELEALEARERMLRRMRRQVTHLGDCYQELGLSPGDGAPSHPADRARLAECVARRQRLAEASEAGPSTPHGVVEWDVVVEGRTGTAVYQGGRLAVPLSR